MSRTKSLLLAALPLLAVFIILIVQNKTRTFEVPSFSWNHKWNPPVEQANVPADGTKQTRYIEMPEGKQRHIRPAIEQAWRDGLIHFEGDAGQSEEDPLVVRMSFPRRDHSFDLDDIIPLYMKQNIPGSTFGAVYYDMSNHPISASYTDAHGAERMLWFDARYSFDWVYWIRIMLGSFAGSAAVSIYGRCRKRPA